MARKKRLLIVKLDAIGDYILFRDFLSLIRYSEKYREFNITLCGNIIWRDIAERFDKEYVDSFIWVDINVFSTSRLYRNLFYIRLKLKFYEEVICPVYSRRFFIEDDIVKRTLAKRRIGGLGDLFNSTEARNQVSKRYYTNLIQIPNEKAFEFYRNKQFFQVLLDQKIELDYGFTLTRSVQTNSNYIIVCPGAGAKFRMWSPENFAKLCSRVISQFEVDIFLCGSSSDKEYAKIIFEKIESNKVVDKCGCTSLTEMLDLIQGAKVTIANESSPIHMAAALGVNAICISNGNHFGRFNPYPEEITSKIETIYPPSITSKMKDKYDELLEHYFWGSNENINEITVDEVFEVVQKVLA